MDWMAWAGIYLGTGAALGWLRREQGRGLGQALFALVAWPLDWLGAWLAPIAEAARHLEAWGERLGEKMAA